MSVHADLFGQGASEVIVTTTDATRFRYVVDATSGARKGCLHLTQEAADSLYLKLGAALHESDEPAREAAYQEQQVKDALEHAIDNGTFGVPLAVEEPPGTWRWHDLAESQQNGENRD